MPWGNQGKDSSDVSISQGILWISGKPPKLEEAREDPPLEPSQGAWPCRHLDFTFLASGTVRD